MGTLGTRASGSLTHFRVPNVATVRAPAHQRSRWRLVSLGALLGTACDTPPTPPDTLESNVTVLIGAEVTTTDDAVMVGGVRKIELGDRPKGMIVGHSTTYTYGGLFEHVNDELVDESWYMDVYRQVVSRESGDTIFKRFLDFGDVFLEGTPAVRFEIDTAGVYPRDDHVLVRENYIMNRVLMYSQRLNMDGSTVSFAHEPYYERMVGGGALELTASGSADIEPMSASIRLQAGARVTRLSNGVDLDFHRERPVLRTDQPLVVELSRPLDPDKTLLILSYVPEPGSGVDPETQRRASAVFELKARTDRVVIPASALAEMASHLPEDEAWYDFRVYEQLLKEDAFDIVRVDGGAAESVSGSQANSFDFWVGLRR